MSHIKRYLVVDLAITVSGGTGSATFNGPVRINMECFNAPNNATFDFDITDDAGYGVNGKTNNSGDVTYTNTFDCQGKCTLTISNATNGAYSIRFYGEPLV